MKTFREALQSQALTLTAELTLTPTLMTPGDPKLIIAAVQTSRVRPASPETV